MRDPKSQCLASNVRGRNKESITRKEGNLTIEGQLPPKEDLHNIELLTIGGLPGAESQGLSLPSPTQQPEERSMREV